MSKRLNYRMHINKNKKPIKILYISNTPHIFGGAGRSLLSLIKYLPKDRFILHFASIYDGAFAKMIKELGVPFVHLSGLRLKNPFPFFISMLKLYLYLRKEKIDIVHVNRISEVIYAFYPAKLAGVPIIAHHRDMKFNRLDLFFTSKVDYNICISKWIKDHFVSHNCIVVHNGIELNTNIPITKNKFKRDLGLSNSDILIGIVGRISPIKGQECFLRAAEEVSNVNGKCHFLLLGGTGSDSDKKYLLKLKEMTSSFWMKDKVHFIDMVNDAREAIEALDISVVPSHREPFGRVIIESMAMKKPVIATSVGGPLDIVTKETGILVPPKDSHSLAKAMIELIKDKDKRIRMGLAGRKRVEEHFTIQHTVKKIMEFYSEILM